MRDADEDLPGLLYSTDRTRVFRLPATGTGPALVRKQALGQHARRRLRHEAAVLRRLRHVPGVTRLAEEDLDGLALILEETGGQTLGARLAGTGPLPPTDVILLASRLSQVLADVHRAGVIHRDISPANVMVRDDGRPVLVDFDLATTAAEVRPAFLTAQDIAGTMP
ncbi:hypothetical protein Aph02nite_39700 [Actinoplanes philippinensis]|uniref:non-specific serine/threonine protein kinase n=1 Tax=Actinoplanes philippinensis TaxID=35752 RepID=A0A1I2GTW1_9ACTN|nr:phosphotransferase [Actinoplanes philippinensis]GIE78020.1 hypothetical protein Aph02nite_39700 [Actinoplanes philippinensis]SFF19991.1 Protein kinase domain-containing protein [Actinoplanes philippinensis]